MKIFAKTLTAGALLSATGIAAAEVSGNVALATDYMFRGVSQTDNQMALQGGFDYAHDGGFYIGTWASNIDSNFFSGTSTDPQLEVDLYAGFAGEMGAIGYDVGVIQYFYPGYDDANTTEFYIGGSYSINDAFSVNAKFVYADELSFVGVDEDGTYFSLGADYSVNDNLSLSAAVGWSSGDAFDTLGAGTGSDSYMDYSVGVSTAFAGVDVGLSYVDTDGDAEDLFGNSVTDGRVVLSISKSL